MKRIRFSDGMRGDYANFAFIYEYISCNDAKLKCQGCEVFMEVFFLLRIWYKVKTTANSRLKAEYKALEGESSN